MIYQNDNMRYGSVYFFSILLNAKETKYYKNDIYLHAYGPTLFYSLHIMTLPNLTSDHHLSTSLY